VENKYLRKLETRTNALAVNLLDKAELHIDGKDTPSELYQTDLIKSLMQELK
jgi:hypothetical protein